MRKINDRLESYIPEIEATIEQEPTFEERIAALEAAMLEQILGGSTNV